MRHLFLAALGALVVSGAVSAQQPQYPQPGRIPATPPAAAAATPVQPASGTTVISGGAGCTNCGTAAGPVARGFTMQGQGYYGSNCRTGAPCQSGCGSLKSDLAFQFGSCKNFFSPCGPTLGGGLFKGHCPTGPMNQPWGTGFGCPRAYDSYTNH